MNAHHDVADYFAVPRPLTSRQKQALCNYQTEYVAKDRERDKEQERDLPAVREELYLQNWGMGS